MYLSSDGYLEVCKTTVPRTRKITSHVTPTSSTRIPQTLSFDPVWSPSRYTPSFPRSIRCLVFCPDCAPDCGSEATRTSVGATIAQTLTAIPEVFKVLIVTLEVPYLAHMVHRLRSSRVLVAAWEVSDANPCANFQVRLRRSTVSLSRYPAAR